MKNQARVFYLELRKNGKNNVFYGKIKEIRQKYEVFSYYTKNYRMKNDVFCSKNLFPP